MRIEQTIYTEDGGWRAVGETSGNGGADLVLAFGGRHLLEKGDVLLDLKGRHPGATVVGC